jgi:deoxyguanosine kinase
VPDKIAVIGDDDFAESKSLKHADEPPRYIAVEGPIGAGKTTLSELLSLRLKSQLILERYEENPFLPQFYEDQKRYAFQTQIFFLLSRYRQQQDLIQTDLFYQSVVSDYIFPKDQIFAAVNLSEDELKLYDQIAGALGKTVPTPDVVVYLQASVGKLEENIRRRGRPYERKVSRKYLEDLVNAYNDFFFHYRETRLIVVDASKMEFLTNPKHVEHLLEAIRRTPHPPVEYLSVAPDTQFALE